MRRTVTCAAGVLLGVLLPCIGRAAEPLLKNATFREWKNGEPVGWEVSIGARRGKGKASVLEKTADGLSLRGDAATREWKFVGQAFEAKPGTTYRLRFEARATDLEREAGQFDNCYVGLFFLDAKDRPVAVRVHTVRHPKWTGDELIAGMPKNAVSAKVMVFLSKTGKLEARSLQLDALKPADSYDVLVEHMDRYYSFFAHRKIDWKSLTEKYRKQVEAAKSEKEFVAVAKELLSHLQDIHVWIVPREGQPVYPHVAGVDGNYDFKYVAGQLKGVQQIGRVAFAGRTKQGFGYISIGALQGRAERFQQIEKAIEGLLDAKGMIVDLRGNRGGNERLAQRIAGIFADKRRVYAQQKFRAGPKHTQFTAPSKRTIEPRKGTTFTKPVVCLVGPRCVSSGEGFAMMMKALPHVTLIGQPTRGASGNPQPAELPNGVNVYFSRWVAMLPDGTVIEGRGVPPDVKVKHADEGDAAFDRALSELAKIAGRD